jgi:hypothetical protein
MSEDQSLGAIALMRNEGNPNAALADLVTQVVGMCGFIGAMGQDKETILLAFDALMETGRKALIEILDEDKEKADGHKAKA